MSTSLVVVDCPHDVACTVQRIAASLGRRKITVFATIDHAAGARAVGLDLVDEVVLVFGNPEVGTGLMQEDPQVGIELPLRLLVWAVNTASRIAFTDPNSLAASYALSAHLPTLARLRSLLDQLVAEAIG